VPRRDTRTPLRALTLNLHKGFSALNRRFVLPELRDAIRGIAADVVFLQEVIGDHQGHAARIPHWPDKSQYEFLADRVWNDYAYGKNAVYTEGHHGNAILSRFPIVSYHNHDVSMGGPERRGLLHCVMKVPGPELELHAICVHLSLTEFHRGQQVELLCKLIREQVPATAPLLVAGDFNDWRRRANGALARCAELKEAFVETAGRLARTYPVRRPWLRLDRIYVRNAQVARAACHCDRPWSGLSDHAALSADIVL
jgi:endonuclease/exonuclease/phosphatase family metal-dependent hydrolase